MKTQNEIEKKVTAYIEEHHLIEPGDRVIAGVSGGADSVCLFLQLLEYQRKVPFVFGVVHIHHGLRPDADLDAAFVEKICEEKNIPFFFKKVDVKHRAMQEHCSTEDAGRRLRYEEFERVAAKWNANKIAVAHNREDRAETILFHLFRGSGLRGLRGILPKRGNLVRPILCLERQEIESYVTGKGYSFCQDSTNAEDDYARNRIRHHILPYAKDQLFSGVVEHLNAAADVITETEDYLDGQTMLAFKQCRTKQMESKTGTEQFLFQVSSFLSFHIVLQKRMLLLTAEELSKTGKDILGVHIRDLLGLFQKNGNRQIHLPLGIVARREYDSVILEISNQEAAGIQEKKLPILEFTVKELKNGQEVPTNKYTKWFDYGKIKEYPAVRFRKQGDYLTIRNQSGELIHKSLQDYMVGEKIPKQMRDFIPVLAQGSHVLWVIGYRISEYYKVTETTKQVLEITVKEENNGG